MKYEVKFDLNRDFDELLIKELLANKFEVDATLSSDEIRCKYFNLKKRLIKIKSRNVYVSKDLKVHSAFKKGFDNIKNKLLKGENINIYLSKNLMKTDYNDSLLNDWGIYHLHLGECLENNNSNFIKRTNPLLFIRIDDHNAYLIDVLDHGNWACQKLIKTVHDNWPKSIEKYLLKGVSGLSVTLSDNDIIKMRKAGVNTAIEIAPNLVYSLLGGGYNSSGLSVYVSREVDYYYNFLYKLQMQIFNDLEQISQDIFKHKKNINNKIELKLIVLNQVFYLEEQNTNSLFNLNMSFPYLMV